MKLLNLDILPLPKVHNLYSSCRNNPCESHETCHDNTRRRHAYSCCYSLTNGEPCTFLFTSYFANFISNRMRFISLYFFLKQFVSTMPVFVTGKK